mmetsp:Transcript_5588/g.13151  ORF Transcript_5588/g.13151 Transcript_5588/m.13151 type:complete len:203 (-) Transcript_5588:1117-1725(-)
MRAAQPERQRGLLQQDCYLPIHTALQLCQLLGGQGGAAHRTQLSQHTQQHKDVAGGAHLCACKLARCCGDQRASGRGMVEGRGLHTCGATFYLAGLGSEVRAVRPDGSHQVSQSTQLLAHRQQRLLTPLPPPHSLLTRDIVRHTHTHAYARLTPPSHPSRPFQHHRGVRRGQGGCRICTTLKHTCTTATPSPKCGPTARCEG